MEEQNMERGRGGKEHSDMVMVMMEWGTEDYPAIWWAG